MRKLCTIMFKKWGLEVGVEQNVVVFLGIKGLEGLVNTDWDMGWMDNSG